MHDDLELRLDNGLIEARPSALGGNGLFAKVAFLPGDLICSYTGRIVTDEEFDELIERGDRRRFYIMKCGDHAILPEDLTVIGGHLANNSCKPNAGFREYPERENTNVLFALRKIDAGEEILIYYAWVSMIDHPCHCGQRQCTGRIGIHLFTGENGELGFDDADVIRLIKVGYANKNPTCSIPLHRLRELSVYYESEETWAAQINEWFTAAFGRGWKNGKIFRWFFSS